MSKSILSVAAVTVAVSLQASPSHAQTRDTLIAADVTPTRTFGSRLAISSGKTYNRVEGLAVHVGPLFTDSSARGVASLQVFGILRSADEFDWDGQNVGHLVRAELRGASPRALGIRLSSYDVVTAIETWQMPAGETGLAAFLFHRDYRDYFGRHGGSGAISVAAGIRTRFEIGYAAERWSSREVRQVLTVLRNNHAWRDNPRVDDGHARLFTVGARIDTRNDARNPWFGWLTNIEYEYGSVTTDSYGPASTAARLETAPRTRYGRFLLDTRRYNRVSPETQLNFRLVAGGWLHGDELPLQRRLSVGGPATIPGVGFRDIPSAPDVWTCSNGIAPAGTPAQCERVLLLQVEYRDELPFRPGTIFGGTPIRIRSAALTVRPTLVAFADIGRGWLVSPRDRVAPLIVVPAPPRDLVYSSHRIPPLETFSTDVGLGVDLGLFGVYAAKSVSESGEPINVILRARARF